MKKYILAGFFFAAAFAQAVEPGRWGIAVQGGYSMPSGSLANWFKPGMSMAVGIGQQYNSHWFLQGMVEHSRFDRENLSGYAEGKLELELTHTALQFCGRYGLSRIGFFQPYMQFTAGMLHWRGVRGTVAAAPALGLPEIDEKVLQEYNWCFAAGLGLEAFFSRSLSLDAGLSYRFVVGDLYPTMQPLIELEGVSGFQTLNAGLGIRYYF